MSNGTIKQKHANNFTNEIWLAFNQESARFSSLKNLSVKRFKVEKFVIKIMLIMQNIKQLMNRISEDLKVVKWKNRIRIVVEVISVCVFILQASQVTRKYLKFN